MNGKTSSGAASPAAEFLRLLQQYIAEHPDQNPMLSRHHPAVVCACNTTVWCTLVDHFGGVTEFWRAFLPALKEWFDPNQPSVELRAVYCMFTTRAAMAEQAGITSIEDVCRQYEAWFAPAKKLFLSALENVSLIPASHVPRNRWLAPNPPDLSALLDE